MTGCTVSTELTLAKGILADLGSPTSLAVSTVSGKLVGNFIGRLNTSLYQCFAINSGAYFDSNLSVDYPALDIYGLLYKIDYYETAINNILGNPNLMWTRLQEGDSTIARESPAKLAQIYQGMLNDANKRLQLLINAYRMANSQAQSIDYYTIQQYGYNYGPYSDGYVYGAWRP